ncbi:MAG: hypothetical protein WD894_03040 [Pirellulales bacterium]
MSTETTDRIDDASLVYLGQWNLLVSTTNWEKGRIIHEWREALIEAAAPTAEYSDDAWSRRVGNVTGQHVGRLRRVYERFGDVHADYAGLYWSHFQAAIDWNDAEMWLEGAIQNRWSVAEMRRERWQAFGGLEEQRPDDSEIVAAEVDEDADPAEILPLHLAGGNGEAASVGPFATGSSGPLYEGPDFGDESVHSESRDSGDSRFDAPPWEDTTSSPAPPPFADLPALPEDLTEAFEGFKLAILRHKTAGWQDVACDDVLRSLDALKALATAPA